MVLVNLDSVAIGGQLYLAIAAHHDDAHDGSHDLHPSVDSDINSYASNGEDASVRETFESLSSSTPGELSHAIEIWNGSTHELVQSLELNDMEEYLNIVYIAACKRTGFLCVFAQVNDPLRAECVHKLVVYAPDVGVSPMQLPQWSYYCSCSVYNFNSESNFDISFSFPKIMFQFNGSVMVYDCTSKRTRSSIREWTADNAVMSVLSSSWSTLHTFTLGCLSATGSVLAVLDREHVVQLSGIDDSTDSTLDTGGSHGAYGSHAQDLFYVRLFCLVDTDGSHITSVNSRGSATNSSSSTTPSTHGRNLIDWNYYSLDESTSSRMGTGSEHGGGMSSRRHPDDIGVTYFTPNYNPLSPIRYENGLFKCLSICLQLPQGHTHPLSLSWRPGLGSDNYSENLLSVFPDKIHVWSAAVVRIPASENITVGDEIITSDHYENYNTMMGSASETEEEENVSDASTSARFFGGIRGIHLDRTTTPNSPYRSGAMDDGVIVSRPMPSVGETVGVGRNSTQGSRSAYHHMLLTLLVDIPMASLVLYTNPGNGSSAVPHGSESLQLRVCWVRHNIASFSEPSLAASDPNEAGSTSSGGSSKDNKSSKSPRNKSRKQQSGTGEHSSGRVRRGSFSNLNPVTITAADVHGILKDVKAATHSAPPTTSGMTPHAPAQSAKSFFQSPPHHSTTDSIRSRAHTAAAVVQDTNYQRSIASAISPTSSGMYICVIFPSAVDSTDASQQNLTRSGSYSCRFVCIHAKSTTVTTSSSTQYHYRLVGYGPTITTGVAATKEQIQMYGAQLQSAGSQRAPIGDTSSEPSDVLPPPLASPGSSFFIASPRATTTKSASTTPYSAPTSSTTSFTAEQFKQRPQVHSPRQQQQRRALEQQQLLHHHHADNWFVCQGWPLVAHIDVLCRFGLSGSDSPFMADVLTVFGNKHAHVATFPDREKLVMTSKKMLIRSSCCVSEEFKYNGVIMVPFSTRDSILGNGNENSRGTSELKRINDVRLLPWDGCLTNDNLFCRLVHQQRVHQETRKGTIERSITSRIVNIVNVCSSSSNAICTPRNIDSGSVGTHSSCRLVNSVVFNHPQCRDPLLLVLTEWSVYDDTKDHVNFERKPRSEFRLSVYKRPSEGDRSSQAYNRSLGVSQSSSVDTNDDPLNSSGDVDDRDYAPPEAASSRNPPRSAAKKQTRTFPGITDFDMLLQLFNPANKHEIVPVYLTPDPAYGIGVRLVETRGKISVDSFKRNPHTQEILCTEASGLVHLGDELICVNEISLVGLPLAEVILLIRNMVFRGGGTVSTELDPRDHRVSTPHEDAEQGDQNVNAITLVFRREKVPGTPSHLQADSGSSNPSYHKKRPKELVITGNNSNHYINSNSSTPQSTTSVGSVGSGGSPSSRGKHHQQSALIREYKRKTVDSVSVQWTCVDTYTLTADTRADADAAIVSADVIVVASTLSSTSAVSTGEEEESVYVAVLSSTSSVTAQTQASVRYTMKLLVVDVAVIEDFYKVTAQPVYGIGKDASSHSALHQFEEIGDGNYSHPTIQLWVPHGDNGGGSGYMSIVSRASPRANVRVSATIVGNRILSTSPAATEQSHRMVNCVEFDLSSQAKPAHGQAQMVVDSQTTVNLRFGSSNGTTAKVNRLSTSLRLSRYPLVDGIPSEVGVELVSVDQHGCTISVCESASVTAYSIHALMSNTDESEPACFEIVRGSNDKCGIDTDTEQHLHMLAPTIAYKKEASKHAFHTSFRLFNPCNNLRLSSPNPNEFTYQSVVGDASPISRQTSSKRGSDDTHHVRVDTIAKQLHELYAGTTSTDHPHAKRSHDAVDACLQQSICLLATQQLAQLCKNAASNGHSHGMIIKNYSKFQHQLPQCFPAHRLDLWASLVVCGACIQASAEQLSCAIRSNDMNNDATVLSSSGGGTTAGCDGKLVLKHSMFVLALLLSSSQSAMWQALVVEPIQRSIRYRVDADEDSKIYSHEIGKTELILPGGWGLLTRKSNCS
jgi:hypothetical protein